MDYLNCGMVKHQFLILVLCGILTIVGSTIIITICNLSLS